MSQNKSSFPYKKAYLIIGLIIGFYVLFKGLIEAQFLLAPMVIAGVLSLVLYPICGKMEKWGMSRSPASLLSTTFLFIISLGVVAIVSFQVQSFIQEWPSIEENMSPKLKQIEDFAIENTPVTQQDVEDFHNRDLSDFSEMISEPGQKAMGVLFSTGSFLTNYVLMLIYVYFILRYRQRFLDFIIRAMPDQQREEVKNTSLEVTNVVSKYLGGKLILMGSLALAYGIGLGISGVESFILVSIIAALLTLVPFIGNIVGFSLALGFGFLVSGDFGVLIGVVITFSVAQFLETYVLQPYVIGGRVNLHPFFVIIMVIVGNAIWGIPGMILAVPITAIMTTVLLHIPYLKIIGLLFQNDPIDRHG